MRLFLGLPVPAQFAQSLSRSARATGLKDARWIPPENIHLTLVFLGSVADETLPAILHELDQLDPPPIRVRITRFGTFPRAGVLFAEVEPTPALLQLQAQVAGRMARCGFPLDDRPYNPHITLARLRAAAARLSDRQTALPTIRPTQFRRRLHQPVPKPHYARRPPLRSSRTQTS
jgi:RNA 2',3'-cyclic 3'-phosphodiesterase